MTNPIGLISMHMARPFTTDHFHQFERLRRLGFDFIELLVPESGELDLTQTRQALQNAGLGIVLAARVNLQRNLTSDDAAIRRAGLDYCRYCIEVAGELGSELVGGPFYGNPLVFAGRAPAPVSEQQRRAREAWCIDGLRRAGEFAAAANIRLAVEPLNRFETDILNTTDQAIALIDAIDLPAVGLLLDTFHMNMEESSVAAAIRKTGSRLLHFQANENHRGMIGTGHIDWNTVCAALIEIAYQGPITLEPFYRGATQLAVTLAHWRPLQHDDTIELHASLRILRGLLTQKELAP
jgi:D-psicose/D-tagatose/L-ribulose 3-epimerase